MNKYTIKDVYNKIADEFSKTRHKIWGSVKTFLDSLEPNSKLLELGCGNGKNMAYCEHLNVEGIDISIEQINICRKRGLNAHEGDITELNYDDNSFDNMICIATYHHLDNDVDRQRCLEEMYRCLRINGKILITVWAMEQPANSKFHFTKVDEMVPWASYLRYYHIYRKGDLEDEIKRLCPKFTIQKVEWELGNWYAIISKIE